MRVICCPNCQEPLPGTAKYCAKCGEYLSAPGQSPDTINENLAAPTVKIVHRPAALKVSRFYAMDNGANVSTRGVGRRMIATSPKPRQNALVSSRNALPPAEQRVSPQENSDDDELQRRATWEKVVTYKTPRIPSGSVTPPMTVASGPPAGSTPPALIRVRKPPPKHPRRIPAQLFSWISILILVGLLLGGIFGLVVSFGRGILTRPPHNSGVPSLQVTPPTVALGGIITLRGSSFSPSGRVGLTRDTTNISVVDTGGANFTHADQAGSFSDTVNVDPSWGAGAHVIHAEDTILHKPASFTVTVTGQSASLRPPHLLFSPDTIDLGSGDQATNSPQVITLSTDGGGQINWQATATQSWLMISPKSGTFSNGQDRQVVVAADRSNLKVGSYSASVIFTSNAGNPKLQVKMIVTQLQPGHEAVLQLTPAVLSFTGTDGGTSPPAQVVTVSNPGVGLPLQWSASSFTYDGSSWLSVDPQSGTVTKGSSQAVTIGVNISAMLPGVYSGGVTFTSQGAVAAKDSPQTIYISLVVLPQCGIQVSPGGLTFAGVYLQPPPAQKIINVGVSQGCSTPLSWSSLVTTSSGGKWLSVGPTGGVTPAYPSVNVAVTGLKPGTYSGSVIFSWSGGTQALPVTFIMGQPTTPIVTATPVTMPFSGIIGQPGPVPQIATITNTGGGTLTWHAAAATTVGGAWLAITPVSGVLASQLPAKITVTATLLKTLTAGTYTGTITITGADSAGHPAAGSPLSIPVSFVVQAPCGIAATPPALVFQGVIGQPNPVAQAAAVTTSGACVNALTWTAATATVPAGGTWLTATPATGTASLTVPSATSVGVVLTGLTAGTYTGTVTITAIDSVTKLAVGTPMVVTVTLTVQPVCTLQAPPVTGEIFSTEAALNPATQSFTVGVIGACTGNVTVTPTATMASGTGWLAVSPASATVASGGSAIFTVTVASAALAAGPYTGSISLAAVNGGIAITGSPQTVGVTLNVSAPPALTAGPGLTFNVITGTVSQPVSITNSGGEPLNWTAALSTDAPSYVSLSATSGTNLAGGASATVNVVVNATGIPGGTSVTTSVVISAIDPITGLPITGSPSTVSVTITIPPPQMALSANALTFTTTVGNNPAAQIIKVQNTGGDTLTWSAGTPSQTWLTVTPASGSDAAGQSSPLTFSVNVAGLAAGTYPATVVITPTPGTAVTVNVTLVVN